ncbi:MAG: GNAT family N-acetyltransferase [Prevotella sp.]|jgi:hypothetical protein|nr:GNAT family N-acetyltransferase [Prevotella sp.]
MIEIVRYTPDRTAEWDAFVGQSKNATFLFYRGYMDYHADRFADYSLMFFENGKLSALLPANRLDDVLYSHQGLTYGGLITTRENTTAQVCHFFAELNAFLRNDGFRRVVYKPVPSVYHQLPAEEDLYALFVTCHAQLLGRDVSSVILPANLIKWKRDRHYAANKARTNGIQISQSHDFAAFWQILSDNLRQKFGASPVHSLTEIQLLHSRFPENICLWVAHGKDGELLAGTVLYLCGDVVRSQYISASPEGKRLHAVDGLYDHIIHHAYPDARYIDLGTSNMPHSSDLHISLIYQKEGFGGRAVCFDTYEWMI